MVVSFILDNKERVLFSLFEDTSVNLDVKQLEIGDFQIWIDEELKCIIERKSIADLEASVKDGRWREQKSRIRESLPNIPLLYIIEGQLPDNLYNDDTILKKMINGCIIGASIQDDIPFIYTKSIEDTQKALLCIIHRVEKNPDKYFVKNTESTENQECRVASSKTKKIDNINTTTCYLMQLASIPRISYKKAQKIAEYTKTSSIFELCKVLSTEVSVKKAFADCKGIGPTLAQNIFEYCGITNTNK